jgi:beta-ketodecanoyl-[acyl-carrier-protein] synthase
MHQAAITGHGVFTPSEIITNDELVAAFNAHADRWNAANAEAIAAGEVEAKQHSSSEFIVAASGIEQRYVLDKTGVLDPDVMHPWLRERSDDEPGQMAEMALEACRAALAMAGVDAGDVDASSAPPPTTNAPIPPSRWRSRTCSARAASVST